MVQVVGDAVTALKSWLVWVQYQEAQHAKVLDAFDREQLGPAAVCVDGRAAAGKCWATALCKHAPAASRWQYVHRAYAHDEEDKLQNGHRDATDDSIIEKGHKLANKRKGQIFHGGTNETNKRVRSTITHENEDGGITQSQSASRKLPMGRAAQLHKLAFAATAFVDQRPPKRPRGRANPAKGTSVLVKSEQRVKKAKRNQGSAMLKCALNAGIA
jgi:hypothetical protein